MDNTHPELLIEVARRKTYSFCIDHLPYNGRKRACTRNRISKRTPETIAGYMGYMKEGNALIAMDGEGRWAGDLYSLVGVFRSD